MTKKVTSIARERKPRVVYSEEIILSIVDRIANGESLNSICKGNGMPTRKSFFEWVSKNESARIKYEVAMQLRADFYADQIVAIADELTIEARHQGEDVILDVSSTAVARNRLRVDARKWYASKLAPKKYGDKLESVVTGADGGPVQHSVKIKFV